MCALLLFAALAATGQSAVAEAAPIQTLEDTAYAVSTRLERFGTVEIDTENWAVTLTTETGEHQVFFPHNLAAQLQQESSLAEQEALIDRYIMVGLGASQSATSDTVLDKGGLRLLVRTRDFLEVLGAEAPTLPLPGELAVFLAEDSPEHVAIVTADKLRASGLTQTEAFGIALRNTDVAVGVPEITGQRIYMLSLPDDTYVASLLVVPRVWVPFEEAFGEVVVAVLARDLVLVVDGRDASAVADLRKLASDIEGELAYPLTKQLFVRKNGVWKLH
ncbi:hypothetical protein [Shimia sp. NS0008-38b]|uniref:hypothetical protein n=1 Tax=Shimia sp. NS0008-38b TaxID=3127653 RepID=UPI0033400A9F